MININKTMIEKPVKPSASDCCGGGSCCPCVMDDYKSKMKAWRRQQGLAEVEVNKPSVDENGLVWPIFASSLKK